MKIKSLGLFGIIIVLVCISGCASSSRSSEETFVTFSDLVFPEIMWYGANLGYFPPKARDWIMNEQFSKEKMESPSMINPSLRVWWSDCNNKVLMEASYTVAPGYVGAGTIKTWGQGA